MIALCALGALCAVGTEPAAAQSEGEPAPTARESRTAAEAARHAAERARAELDEAREQMERAEGELRAARRELQRTETRERAEAETEPAPAAEPTETAETAAPPTSTELEALRARVEEAREQAERAERRAEAAERKAERALAEVAELRERFAYDRTGFYVGGGAYWAPEDFATDLVDVDDSRGAMGRVGYRLHRNVALDARFDLLDDFDLSGSTRTATLDGYAISGNLRLFLLPARIQPWIGIGGGVAVTDFRVYEADGSRVELPGDLDGEETDPLFRISGGLDLYLTSHMALTLEAAYVRLLDERDGVSFGQLGAGLDFRF